MYPLADTDIGLTAALAPVQMSGLSSSTPDAVIALVAQPAVGASIMFLRILVLLIAVRMLHLHALINKLDLWDGGVNDLSSLWC
jgi:hypothetical protein